MKKFVLGLLLTIAFAAPSFAAIQGQDVEYKAGDTTLKGYLVYDDTNMDKRPGVLVVHEWWGNNDYSRKRAAMLAELGYVALAVDMYGDGKQADNPTDAGKLSKEIYGNPQLAKERFLAALEYLKGFNLTDASRIGAIGYCFGGSTVLTMAMAGVDVNGVVSFHGSIPKPPSDLKPEDVKAKVLVCHGGADGFIKPEEMDAFKGAMDTAQADYKVIVYDGAKHAFTNPDADKYAEKFQIPVAYDAAADQKSWADMQAFFKDVLSE